ncbi:MAG: NAD(P)-dependent oxidoreductase [Actinocrinis sp.]
MRLVVHGATGRIGGAILAEALARGHVVTAVVRASSTAKLGDGKTDGVTTHRLDLLDQDQGPEIVRLTAEHDATISAIGWTQGQPQDVLVRVARALLPASGGRPLLVVGGSGTLMTASGKIYVETPGFPPERRANSLAHVAALDVYRAAHDVPWIYLCPPAVITQDTKTGKYRVGAADMVTDDEGRSAISVADYATAAVDLLERPDAERGHLNVAY